MTCSKSHETIVRAGILLLFVSWGCEDIGKSPLKTVNCCVKDKISRMFFQRSGLGVLCPMLGGGS